MRHSREEALMDRQLEMRIVRLEKSNRRWKLAGLLGAGAIACGVLMGQIRMGGGGITAPSLTVDKVTSKTIILTDAAGTERANLSLDANDAAVLSLKEKGGTTTMELRAEADGSTGVK